MKYGLTDALRDRAVCAMLRLVGTPYVWGGNLPDPGLDCSGAILLALREASVHLPDLRARDIYKQIEKFTEPKDAKMGDLVFYGKVNVIHVAMVITPGATVLCGANGGRSFKGVGIDRLYWGELDAADRILYRHEMKKRGARVRVETGGWNYRPAFRGFGRIPL